MGCIKPIYSRNQVAVRITLRSMRPWFDLTMNTIGCTLLSSQKRAIYSTQSLSRQQMTLLQTGFRWAPWQTRCTWRDCFHRWSASHQRACRKHDFYFRYERHENRNNIERTIHQIKRRADRFSNCFSNVDAETTAEWLRSFAFTWNQRIWIVPAIMAHRYSVILWLVFLSPPLYSIS